MRRCLTLYFLLMMASPPLSLASEAGKLYKEALTLFKGGDYGKAIPLLEQARLSYPILADHATFYLGQALFQQREWEKAINAFSEIPRLYPDSIWVERAMIWVGDVQMEMGQSAEARQTYQGFIKERPSSHLIPEARLKVGLTYIRGDRYEEAYKTFMDLWLDYPLSVQAVEAARLKSELIRAKKVKPREPPVERWHQRAMTLFNSGLYGQAIQDLKEILKSPQLSRLKGLEGRIWLNLGISYFRSRRYQEAKATFERAWQKFPQGEEGGTILLWLGRTALRQGDNSLARDYILSLLSRFPQGELVPQALMLLGQAAEDEKDEEGARRAYLKLVEDYWGSKEAEEALWRTSWFDYKAGHLLEALKGFKKLAEAALEPIDRDKATFWQAKVLERLGEVNAARLIYRSLAEGAPLSYYGSRAREKLETPLRRPIPIPINWLVAPARIDGGIHLEKAQELIRLELKEDAVREIEFALYTTGGDDKLLAYGSHLLYQLGDFRRGHQIARRAFADLVRTSPPDGPERLFWQLAYPIAYREEVERWAGEFKIDPLIILAVMREESAFHPQAISRSGAIGLMQVIPSTGRIIAQEQGIPNFSPEMLNDPSLNVRFGTWYLVKRLEQFWGDEILALASYNAGYQAVLGWMVEKGYRDGEEFIEDITYQETRNYIKRVLRSYEAYRAIYRPSS